MRSPSRVGEGRRPRGDGSGAIGGGLPGAVIVAAAAPAASERAGLEEFEAALDGLAEGHDNVPSLAPEALTHEAIYGHRG
jgi:hypothetical protein